MADLIVDLVLGVHIPRYKEGTDKDNSHAIIYEIEFTAQKLVWTVKKRYRELRALHQALIKAKMQPTVQFPPKNFMNNRKPKFLDIRRRELEIWLRGALSLPGCLARPDVQAFVDFPPSLLSSLRPAAQTGGPAGVEGDAPIAWLDAAALRMATVPLTDATRAYDTFASAILLGIDGLNPTVAAHTKRSLDLCAAAGLAPPTPANPITAVATQAYKSNYDRDLRVSAGTLVTLTGIDESTGWLLGSHDCSRGLLPAAALTLDRALVAMAQLAEVPEESATHAEMPSAPDTPAPASALGESPAPPPDSPTRTP